MDLIVTHSPIIMAYLDAVIYEIKDTINEVKYEYTENYQIMKSFINNKDKMIRILMN